MAIMSSAAYQAAIAGMSVAAQEAYNQANFGTSHVITQGGQVFAYTGPGSDVLATLETSAPIVAAAPAPIVSTTGSILTSNAPQPLRTQWSPAGITSSQPSSSGGYAGPRSSGRTRQQGRSGQSGRGYSAPRQSGRSGGSGRASYGGAQQQQTLATYIPGFSILTPQESQQMQQLGLSGLGVYIPRPTARSVQGAGMPLRMVRRASLPRQASRGLSGNGSQRSGGRSSGSYGGGYSYRGQGGSSQLRQPQTQQTYIPGLSITTPQDSYQIQQGQNAADYQMGYAPSSNGSSSLSYQEYLEQLAQLQQAAQTTATATAATVPVTPTTAVNPSWFTEQTIIAGVPNWTFLAGGAVVLWMMMSRRR